jgi:hypothetical protein
LTGQVLKEAIAKSRVAAEKYESVVVGCFDWHCYVP